MEGDSECNQSIPVRTVECLLAGVTQSGKTAAIGADSTEAFGFHVEFSVGK